MRAEITAIAADAAARCLGRHHNVADDAAPLVEDVLAGAREPGLDLVVDQERTVAVA
jgi:hypothetical protein